MTRESHTRNHLVCPLCQQPIKGTVEGHHFFTFHPPDRRPVALCTMCVAEIMVQITNGLTVSELLPKLGLDWKTLLKKMRCDGRHLT